jgi:hypothetical protein
MGTGSFPGVKRPGRGAGHPPFWCRGQERVELYLYPPSRPAQACNGSALPFVSKYKNKQDRQYTCNVTLRRVRVTIVVAEKQFVLNILCVCVCVCVCSRRIQHAKRMSPIGLLYVAYPAVKLLYTLSHKRHDIRKKKVLNVKYVF